MLNQDRKLKFRWSAKLSALYLLICFACGIFAFADQRELKTGSSDQIDAVLLLDASGSMLQTDPQKLRNEGARLFVESLRAEDRLAIVQFSSDTKIIRPLSTVATDQKDQINESVKSVEASGLYTDLYAAVSQAKDILTQEGRPDTRQLIILLSDGKMDPDPAVATGELRTRNLIDNLLPEVKAKDIKIYTLSFSDQADHDLLSEISAATDGLNWFTPSSDKIHESYTSLFLAVKKPQIVPLTSKGLHIDENVQEATFYINREEGAEPTVLAPNGDRITADTQLPNIKWFRGQKFDAITVIKPVVGDWQVQGLASQEGFATVLTDLKLVSDWSSSIYSGSSYLLQARLYDSEKPVVLPEMTGAAQYAFQITPTDRVSEPIVRDFLVDDGTHGDKVARDGIFSSELRLDDPGDYKLSIILKAPTFERTQQIPFKVKPRFVSLKTEEVEAPASAENVSTSAQKIHQFVVELSPEVAGFSKVQVQLKAVDEERKRLIIPVVRSKEKNFIYRAAANALPHDGKYSLQAFVTGIGKKGDLKEESNLIEYEHKGEAAEPENTEIVVVPKIPTETPWWPFAFGTAAFNLGLAFMFFSILGKSQTQVSFAMPTLAPLDDITQAIEALKAKAALTEIDLADPRLAKDFQVPKTLEAGGASAAPAPEAPKPEAAASEAAPNPETEAAAEAAAEAPAEAAEPAAAEEGGEEE